MLQLASREPVAEHSTNTMEEGGGLTLAQLRKQFVDYATVKLNEVDEMRQAWRYYHGVQYTKDQVAILEKRHQPIITFNRVTKKVDGLVGIMRKLRTDPKAFPRREQGATAAQLATEVTRYIMDDSRWEDIEAFCLRDAAVGGVGVCELGLVQGDHQDPDVIASWVDPVTFFYDPRSVKPDFSDARYLGVSRWASDEEIQELFPDVDSSKIVEGGGGAETTQFEFDRQYLWINERKKIRLVEHWYKRGGVWYWCIYANWSKFREGRSPFVDAKGQSACRYRAFSAYVDHEGDRYGIIRNLKGPQDAINQHRSKAMHIMNTRQLFARQGIFQDIEVARREIAKPDGVLIYNGTKDDWSVEQPAQEFLQQTQYFEDAKNEIEMFGPSPALISADQKAASGRALAMQQTNGLAELGTLLTNFKRWKLDCWRLAFLAARDHWTAERAIRITSSDEIAQFIKLNSMQFGPDGFPQMVNQLGVIDVDFMLDEGPDTENVMGDVNDILLALAQNGVPIPPQVFLELAALPESVKNKLLKMLSQPDPAKEQATQIQLAEGQAKVMDTQASAKLKEAQAMKAFMEAHQPQDQGQTTIEMPDPNEANESQAKVMDTLAAAELKRAQTDKIYQDIQLAPQKMAQDAQMKREQFAARNQQQARQ